MAQGITSTRRHACTEFYAIQHVPTGAYLPQERTDKFDNLRFTSVEPDLDLPPALFVRHCDATASMNLWLKGRLTLLRTLDWHPEYADFETVTVGSKTFRIEPVSGRNPEHMAVVTMLVVERKQPR